MELKAKEEHKCSYVGCPRENIIRQGETFTWTINPAPRKFYHEQCFKDMKAYKKHGTPVDAVVVEVEETVKKWVPAPEKLLVGTRVIGCESGSSNYEGVVYDVEYDLQMATIKRDDKRTGGGKDNHWVVNWEDGKWGASSTSGQIYIEIEVKVKTEKKKTTAMVPVEAVPDNGMAAMARLLAPHMAEVGIERAREAVKGDFNSLRKSLQDEITAKLNIAPRKLEVLREDGKAVTVDLAHEKFETLLHLINHKDHVYLWGPPGSGKSTAAHQVSTALGLEWGYISLNPQTPDSRLLGFVDANGKYRDTVFRRIYQTGGVMCIDELDNSSPSLCVTINSGLENGHMAFPDGMVERHKDFVLVATGNTTGRGANHMFPERRPFDAAFQERFVYLEWDYDTRLESAIALSINDGAQFWLDWVWKMREHCHKNHPRIIVSPRASFKGAKHLKHGKFKMADLAEMVIFKGIDADTRKSILSSCPLPVKA